MKGFTQAIGAMMLGALLLASGFLAHKFLVEKGPQDERAGSVQVASEYSATTTQVGTQTIMEIATSSGSGIYNSRSGVLGSLVITKVGTATIELFDATTTNQNLRAASMTTATIRLGSFPASVAVGTYVFDARYRNGLIAVFSSDIIPSTTITYR